VVVSVAAAILAGPEVRAVRVVVRGQAEELEEPQWPRADHAAGLDTPPPVPTQRRGLGRGEHAYLAAKKKKKKRERKRESGSREQYKLN
jgi:hypothetical protein